MKLVVQELIESSGIDQLVIPNRYTNVKAIRPHIYRHNFPVGTLKVQILDADENFVAESSPVTIANIGSMDYFHGYVRFDVDAGLTKDTQYILRLLSDDGYVFDEAAYIGWCNGFDLAKYPINGTPASHFNYPMDYEIWERTQK